MDTRKASKKNFLEVVQLTPKGNITEWCQRAGIARSAFYKWCHQDEKFKANFHRILDEIVYEARGVASSLLQSTDERIALDAAKYILDRRGKDIGYSPKQEVEHSGKVDSVTTIEIVEIRKAESGKTQD